MKKDKRAIHPVIATVIIVAIAIAIAIAVAFWTVGLSGIYKTREKLEVSSYTFRDSDTWYIIVGIENKGNAPAIVESITLLKRNLRITLSNKNSERLTWLGNNTLPLEIPVAKDPMLIFALRNWLNPTEWNRIEVRTKTDQNYIAPIEIERTQT